MPIRKLFFGDNLEIMREHVADESVDLVYLDPPFNSKQSYNVLFKERDARPSRAQIEAFEDTWHWTPETQHQFELLMTSANVPREVAKGLDAFRIMLGENDVMAYLVMMAPRLMELHRVLKSTGSMYLHCDPTASHYLKVICDQIFDPRNFRNEIVWRRSNAHNKTTTQYGPIHDTILFYSRSSKFTFHPGRGPYSKAYIEDRFTLSDARGRYQLNYLTGPGTRTGQSGAAWRGFDPTKAGRHWAVPASLREFLPNRGAGMSTVSQLEALLSQALIIFPKKVGGQPMYKQHVGPGVPYQDVWAYQPNTKGVLYQSDENIDQDVKWLEAEDEKLGFDTQKPVGLLTRILKASSNDGDVVLDPFCGCGTTVAAAEALGRSWIGIDITFLAIALIEKRLTDSYPSTTYEVHGVPKDTEGAKALFEKSHKNFETWAVTRIGGRPQFKGGGDEGIDGVIRSYIDGRDWGTVLVSVKGGDSLNPSMVRDLVGTVRKDRADMGVLITRAKPTKGMYETATKDGFYRWPGTGQEFPRIQILSVEDLLRGMIANLPPIHGTYAEAPRAIKGQGEQLELGNNGEARPPSGKDRHGVSFV